MRRPAPIGSVVGGLLTEISKRKEIQDKLWSAWEKAAGEEAARHTRRLQVKESTLQVVVDSSTWAHELSLRSSGLLKELVGAAGPDAIRRLRFRLG